MRLFKSFPVWLKVLRKVSKQLTPVPHSDHEVFKDTLKKGLQNAIRAYTVQFLFFSAIFVGCLVFLIFFINLLTTREDTLGF